MILGSFEVNHLKSGNDPGMLGLSKVWKSFINKVD